MPAGPRMHPERLPDAVRGDPRLSAECEVFDALSRCAELEGGAVHHSCRWHADVRGERRDGEADFLVAHPGWGFVSLEVKGGRIGFDARRDKWTSTDRHGTEHEISNPFRQAEKSKRVVLDFLRANWPGHMPYIKAAHGVIFPHSEDGGRLGSLPAYAPPDITVCSDHLAELGPRIARMLSGAEKDFADGPGAFGQRGLDTLAAFRGKSVDLGPRPATRVSTVDNRIVELTREQNKYLKLLQRQSVAVLEGGAGTGKTMLALEQARRWAEEGKSVLLLCFNNGLASALSDVLQETPVSVSTFHAFCNETAEAAGIGMAAERAAHPKIWMSRLPDRLQEVAIEGPDSLFDAIIIDEAQDFRVGWIESLGEFLVPDGCFWCFRDYAQNVQFGEDLNALLNVHPFQLYENVRNARPVFEASEPFRMGDPQTSLGPDGPEVDYIGAGGSDPAKTVIRTVNALLTEDRIPPGDIAVLLEKKAEAEAVSEGLANRSPGRADQASQPGLVVDTVRRFKGLDRPVVVLASPGLDRALDYVGYTRARSRLIVVRTEPASGN